MVADTEIVKRKLRDLRVVDLKNELERRGLDKSGVKATLMERLSKALQDDGHDADEFIFEIAEKKTVGKRSSIGKQEHDASDFDGVTDGGDAPSKHLSSQEIDNIKEEIGVKGNINLKPAANNASDMNTSVNEESKPSAQTEDSSLNQENNDGAEDFINLNLEEEEEFGEEEHHSKDKDETSLRIGSTQQQFENDRPAKSPIGGSAYGHSTSSSSGAGTNDATPISGKTSSARDTVVEEQKADTETNKGADKALDSMTTSSGEKVKSGPSGSKDGSKSAARDDRDKKKGSTSTSSGGVASRNLWVSGLSSTTRATDLKHLFSKYGKVVGAKVVTNARTPGTRCFGYVTMSTSEEASECIERLDRSELHGRMISVERAKGDGSRRVEAKTSSDSKLATEAAVSGSEKSEAPKESGDTETNRTEAPSLDLSTATGDALSISSAGNTKDNHEERSSVKEGDGSRGGSSQRERPPRDKDWFDQERRNRQRRGSSPHRHRQVLTHKQIKEEHERQRLREREREEHRAERRRQEELARLREHEKRQRDEAFRLEKERERLRKEREQLERERLRFERERLERERAELQREREKAEAEEMRKRSFGRVEDVRRAPKRPGERDDYYGERKRITVDPPVRYDASSRYEESTKSAGHFTASGPLGGGSDFRGTKGFDSRARFERSGPSGAPGASNVTRRVVQEVPQARRPHSPPPQRDRADDRRIVDRGRDERYDRGNRGRDSYGDREQRRDREQRQRDERPGGTNAPDSMRNRMPERDHRERYDSRSGKDGPRYNDRGSDSWQRNSSAVGSNPSGTKGNYPAGGGGMMGNGGSAWNGNGGGQSDRWVSSSSISMGRSMGSGSGSFNNSWTASAPPMSSAVFNPPIGGMGTIGGGVIGQSGSVNYSGDRYSSRH